MVHGSIEEHTQTLANIREAEKSGERPIGVLVDLAGPKMRLGELLHEPLTCARNAEFHLCALLRYA